MDVTTFEAEVFDAHHTKVWRFLARAAGRDAADDLAGEVFVRAWAHRHRYDPARGAVESWLYGIAANLLHDRWRQQGRAERALARHAAAQAPVAPDRSDDVDARVDDERRLDAALAALASLSDADRAVLRLAVVEGLGQDEIAAALDVPVGTVKSRLSRARTRLRERLDASGEVTTDG